MNDCGHHGNSNLLGAISAIILEIATVTPGLSRPAAQAVDEDKVHNGV